MDHAGGAAMKMQAKEKMRWLYFYLIVLCHLFLFTVLSQCLEWFDSSPPSFLCVFCVSTCVNVCLSLGLCLNRCIYPSIPEVHISCSWKAVCCFPCIDPAHPFHQLTYRELSRQGNC